MVVRFTFIVFMASFPSRQIPFPTSRFKGHVVSEINLVSFPVDYLREIPDRSVEPEKNLLVQRGRHSSFPLTSAKVKTNESKVELLKVFDYLFFSLVLFIVE